MAAFQWMIQIERWLSILIIGWSENLVEILQLHIYSGYQIFFTTLGYFADFLYKSLIEKQRTVSISLKRGVRVVIIFLHFTPLLFLFLILNNPSPPSRTVSPYTHLYRGSKIKPWWPWKEPLIYGSSSGLGASTGGGGVALALLPPWKKENCIIFSASPTKCTL